MAQRQEKSQVVIFGKETLSGSKSTSGVYKNPKAEAEIYNKNLKINLEKNITKLILKVLFEYEEATTRKDIPNFLFSLKQNGKEFAKSFWSDPDVFYKFEEHHGELIIEIDLEKFYSDEEKTKLNFSAHLECWLEESSWRGGAPQKTAAASSDADLEINLPKIQETGAAPEIELKISPTHSPGKDLKNYVNADWGQPYFLKVHLENKSNNTLTSGNFTLFENNKNIKDATLKKELESKWKTIIISEDNATWVMIKDWKWYKDIGGGKFGERENNRHYEYLSKGKTIDEFNFVFDDLKSNKISVNVRVPDYKIEALRIHNQMVDLIFWYMVFGGVAAVIVTVVTIGAGALAAALAAIFGVETLGGGITISGSAEDIRNAMKRVMDDPPRIDENFKKVIHPKLIKLKVRTKNRLLAVKTRLNLFSKNLVKNLKVLEITNNRLFTARLKKNKKYVDLQKSALIHCARLSKQNIRQLSKSYLELSKIFETIKISNILINETKAKLKNKKYYYKMLKNLEKQQNIEIKNKEYLHKTILSLKQLPDLSRKTKQIAILLKRFERSLNESGHLG